MTSEIDDLLNESSTLVTTALNSEEELISDESLSYYQINGAHKSPGTEFLNTFRKGAILSVIGSLIIALIVPHLEEFRHDDGMFLLSFVIMLGLFLIATLVFALIAFFGTKKDWRIQQNDLQVLQHSELVTLPVVGFQDADFHLKDPWGGTNFPGMRLEMEHNGTKIVSEKLRNFETEEEAYGQVKDLISQGQPIWVDVYLPHNNQLRPFVDFATLRTNKESTRQYSAATRNFGKSN